MEANTAVIFRVGDKVRTDSGFDGTIYAVLSGQLDGLYEVRMSSGITCLNETEIHHAS